MNSKYEGLFVIVHNGGDFILTRFKYKGEYEVIHFASNEAEGKRILKMYKEGYGRE